jgi:hypothetical protein
LQVCSRRTVFNQRKPGLCAGFREDVIFSKLLQASLLPMPVYFFGMMPRIREVHPDPTRQVAVGPLQQGDADDLLLRVDLVITAYTRSPRSF